MNRPLLSVLAWFAMSLFPLVTLCAQQNTESSKGEVEAQQPDFARFQQMLSGARLIGHFTILGKEDRQPSQEEYTISRVAKLSEGDYWLFHARIKYGDKDYTVPLPLEVKWAADTPMITLTDLKILGQGPFSARVLFHDNKYAGTWSHGKVSGHLFGRIEKLAPPTGIEESPNGSPQP